MRNMKLAMSGLFLVAVVFALSTGGTGLAFQGIKTGFLRLVSVVALVGAAYIISGLAQVMVKPEAIQKWMGSGSGLRGALTALVAGALTPGGPYVFYPLAASLARAGVGMSFLLIYLAGKMVWDVWRIPMELALLGSTLAVTRWVFTCFIPILVVVLGITLFKKLPQTSQREKQ